MADGYPTLTALAKIENWPMGTVAPLAEYVCSLWNSTYGIASIERIVEPGDDQVIKVVLTTGGWSGNEDILDVLRRSMGHTFWLAYWYQSQRGGRHEFRVPLASWST